MRKAPLTIVEDESTCLFPAPSEAAVEADESLNKGHRDRLRKRLLRGGANALPDYEILEIILFAASARGDVKPQAKRLLAKFGSISRVLSAEAEQLKTVEGVGEAAAATLLAVKAAADRMLKDPLKTHPVISTMQHLMDYCRQVLQHSSVEQFHVLYLDKKNRLIDDVQLQRGTIDHTQVYPREVLKKALELSATALILVHNHPSGDPTPSEADIIVTQQIITAAEPLHLVVHDHLIIGREGVFSFREHGLLQNYSMRPGKSDSVHEGR